MLGGRVADHAANGAYFDLIIRFAVEEMCIQKDSEHATESKMPAVNVEVISWDYQIRNGSPVWSR